MLESMKKSWGKKQGDELARQMCEGKDKRKKWAKQIHIYILN